MTDRPAPTRPRHPPWLGLQITLSVVLSLLASLWLLPLTPFAALALEVVVGAAVGIGPWFLGWPQRRRGIAIVGGGVIAAVVGSGVLTAQLLVYLAAAATGMLTVRVREPTTPLLPSLAVLLCGVVVTAQVSPLWFAVAVPFAAVALLFGVLRQIASAPTARVRPAATATDVVVSRGRRYVAVPLIAAIAVAGLLLTSLLPIDTGSRRWQVQPLATGLGLNRRTPERPLARLPHDPAHRLTRRYASGPATPALQSHAEALANHPGGTLAGVRRLEAHLRTSVDDVTDGPGGRVTYAAIDDVLTSGRGTPTHKAAALVATVHAAGYEARLLRGRLPPQSSLPGSTGAGDRSASSGSGSAAGSGASEYGHEYVWAEVRVAGVGWVSCQTTDLRIVRATNRTARQLPTLEWSRASVAERLLRIFQAVLSTAVLATLWLLLPTTVALAVAAVVVAVGVRVVERWRRRRTGDSASRVSGAWQELADVLRLRGVDVSPGATPREAAQSTQRLLGEDAARTVEAFAAVADRAWFDQHAPPASDADHAWVLESDARAAVLDGVPVWRRWTYVLDPRPVWWTWAAIDGGVWRPSLPRRRGGRATPVFPTSG